MTGLASIYESQIEHFRIALDYIHKKSVMDIWELPKRMDGTRPGLSFSQLKGL